MRVHRGLVALALAASAAVAVPASAAPPRVLTFSAPYDHADVIRTAQCVDGAVCTPVAAARRTGKASASVRYGRASVTGTDESASGSAFFLQPVKLPRGTRSATVKMTWRVGSAASAASAAEGSVSAYSGLSGVVRCGPSCADVTTIEPLAAACQQQGTVCPWTVFDATPSSSGRRDITLVAEVTGISGNLLNVVTTLTTQVRGGPTCVFPFPGCNPVLTDHRGTGRSATDAQLLRVEVHLP